MRLLIVMERYPLPMRAGGAIVGFNTIKELARRHVIDFLSLKPEVGGQELDALISDVQLVTAEPAVSPALAGRILSKLLFLISPLKYQRPDINLRSAIVDRCHRVKYDGIVLFELAAVKHFPQQLLHRLAVNIEDPQSLRISRMSDLPIWPWHIRLKLRIVAAMTRRYEQAVVPLLGQVFLLSKSDIRDFAQLGGYSNLAHVAYGVIQKDKSEIRSYENRKKMIVYSGNMFHPPNVDGALHFLNAVFPHILKLEPEARFCIVGADPDPRIFEAAQKYGPSVEITGRVENLESYLATAVVSVCPVRLEIGVQTKVLESLSLGTPVVTTHAGNRGIEATSGIHLHAVDDAEKFAAKVCELIRGENWASLSENGWRFVADHFSWGKSAAQLEDHLRVLAVKGAA